MSNMVEVKTAELTGAALNWAVMKIAFDGQDVKKWVLDNHAAGDPCGSPSTDWAQGGPLRDKYKVDITEGDYAVSASILTESCECVDASGPTALVALCRAIVASKLGDVVQVPEELAMEV